MSWFPPYPWYPSQPSWPNPAQDWTAPTTYPVVVHPPGCICPPTSEQTCQSPTCPRKGVSISASTQIKVTPK